MSATTTIHPTAPVMAPPTLKKSKSKSKRKIAPMIIISLLLFGTLITIVCLGIVRLSSPFSSSNKTVPTVTQAPEPYPTQATPKTIPLGDRISIKVPKGKFLYCNNQTVDINEITPDGKEYLVKVDGAFPNLGYDKKFVEITFVNLHTVNGEKLTVHNQTMDYWFE